MTRDDRQPAPAEPTILVVDDEPAVLEAVAGLCEALGYRVLRAQDGQAAQAYLGAGIDLLTTDVRMRHLDGFGLLRRVRADSAALPVIAMTGYADLPELDTMRALGLRGVLRKPFLIADSKALIAQALVEERPATGA